MSWILRAVGIEPFSIWKPSRGPSSFIVTFFGNSDMAASWGFLVQWLHHAAGGGDALAPALPLSHFEVSVDLGMVGIVRKFAERGAPEVAGASRQGRIHAHRSREARGNAHVLRHQRQR